MENNCHEVQVSENHYELKNYADAARFASYHYQVKEALDSGKDDILVIGKGDGIVPIILEGLLHKKVYTFDFDKALQPDYLGDVTKLKEILDGRSFDVIMCCQLLEHLEFKWFEVVLKQISECCDDTFILSLPYRRIELSVAIDLPKLGHKLKNMVIPRFYEKEVPWGGQHYWEVGTRGKQKKDIMKILNKYFDVETNYLVPENTYHWFAVCKKKY